jgi:hypothetical protein
MENIPSDIDFVGKLLKANEDFDQRKERLMVVQSRMCVWSYGVCGA